MRTLWIYLKSSLWFLPAASVLLAAGLAIGLVEYDAGAEWSLAERWPQYFGLGADGSRSLLAAIAQSVITLAGVSFSITIVALSLAANQYSPRVLRNFMRDRGNQVVLGGLVGIFIYCIIVLRTIQGGEESFVPALSVLVGLGLAVIAIGLFVYFVHHVATSIQASSIISSIALETLEVVRELFPEAPDELPDDGCIPNEGTWHTINAPTSGFLQSVEVAALMITAEQHGVVIQMEAAIGEFVVENNPVLKGNWKKKPDRKLTRCLQRCLNIQPFRTIEQDPEFGMRQIVDISVKALSPGINDPTTAITCLHYLTAILRAILERGMPRRCRYGAGKLCVILRPPDFRSLVDLAFGEIRQNSRGQTIILIAVLGAIEKAVSGCRLSREQRLAFSEHANLVVVSAEQCISLPHDLEAVRQAARKVFALIGSPETGLDGVALGH
jgi:uncharacterized membrane protein